MRGSAVAVSATLGTPGNTSRRRARSRYSGRNSWPQAETQCASSIAISASLHPAQAVERAVHEQALRREIEQLERPRLQRACGAPGLVSIRLGVQRAGLDAELAECGHLVVHEGDQRRDDERRAGPAERRNLVAQAFAATRRHEHERVAAGHDPRDGILLQATEGGEPEDAVKDLLRSSRVRRRLTAQQEQPRTPRGAAAGRDGRAGR